MKSIKKTIYNNRRRYRGLKTIIQRELIAPIIQARVAEMQLGSVNGEDLLFVTGFDKSGTTWLMKILNSHPEIVCRGSGQFFNFYKPEIPYLLSPGGYDTLLRLIQDSDWLRKSGRVWLSEEGIQAFAKRLVADAMHTYWQPDIKFVGDKSTVQDCHLIKTLFPKATLIGIMRDGRDVAVSFAYHFQRRGSHSRFTSNGHLDVQYINDIALGWATYAKHMFDVREFVIILKYEKILDNPIETVSNLFTKIKVGSDRQLVEKIVQQNSFKAQSGGRKPGEEDISSFYRKGISGDWKNHFTQDDLALFLQTAGEMLNVWGYDLSRQ